MLLVKALLCSGVGRGSEIQNLLRIKTMLDKPQVQLKNLSFLSLEEICES